MGEKAPSFDGFTMSFIEVCWDTIKVDLMQIIYKFHLKELFEKLMTATFISLITKKANSKELKGHIHIILIERTYKLI